MVATSARLALLAGLRTFSSAEVLAITPLPTAQARDSRAHSLLSVQST